MKQYDLYENTDLDTKDGYPYFVDVQADLLRDLDSRVVIPLVSSADVQAYPENLCPVVEINNDNFALMTQQITTVPRSFLASKKGSLLVNRDQIIAGLDFLLTGV